MRDNFKSIANAIRNDLLSGSCERIMIYANERTVNRIEDKFKTKILVLLASDEVTKNAGGKRKYYVIRIQRQAKLTV